MISRHKLDKAFGPTGAFSGFVILTAGILFTYLSPVSLILVPFGIFMAFTCSSSRLDIEQKRIKFSNDLFGFIPTGKWFSIESDMKIGLKKDGQNWRAYSLSNRKLNIQNTDYRIFLYDTSNRIIMPIKKFDSLTKAKTELKNLSTQLKIGII